MTNNNPHIGSSFDDFLGEDNLLVETNEIAIERVIAWQLQQEIELSLLIEEQRWGNLKKLA